MRLNGKEVELTIVGRCQRDLLGKVHCEIDRVLTADGLNVFGVIPHDELEPMRVRLWTAAINQRHPRGEPEAAV